MKRFLAIALCLCTPACTALDAGTTVAEGITVHADSVSLSATKALAIAADAYAGVANATASAVRAGHFSNEQLLTIRTLNDRAKQLLSGADTSLTIAQRAASLTLVVTQLRSIIGG